MNEINKGEVWYYARALPTGLFEVCELKINTVTTNYFTGVDKRDKRTYMFNYEDINHTVFHERAKALAVVNAKEEQYNTRH